VAPPFSLTNAQREALELAGFLRFEGLIPADAVRRAREAVLAPLARLGLWRDGAWRLDAAPRPQWPATGLKTSKAIGNRHVAVEALIEDPVLQAVVAAVLDGHAFDATLHKRPQVLFTLPNAEAWEVPTGWHVDMPRLASGDRLGAQVFALLDEVEVGGGGTMIIAGSHRLANEGRPMRMKEIKRLLCRDARLRRLFSGAPGDGRELMGETWRVGEVELSLAELTGKPGDAWFVDLRVLHAGAPNAADHPRMMLTHRFVRTDRVGEIEAAFGWR
jgi:hypothetical protein